MEPSDTGYFEVWGVKRSTRKKVERRVKQAARAEGNFVVRLRKAKRRLKARSIRIRVKVERRGVTGHTEKGEGGCGVLDVVVVDVVVDDVENKDDDVEN